LSPGEAQHAAILKMSWQVIGAETSTEDAPIMDGPQMPRQVTDTEGLAEGSIVWGCKQGAATRTSCCHRATTLVIAAALALSFVAHAGQGIEADLGPLTNWNSKLEALITEAAEKKPCIEASFCLDNYGRTDLGAVRPACNALGCRVGKHDFKTPPLHELRSAMLAQFAGTGQVRCNGSARHRRRLRDGLRGELGDLLRNHGHRREPLEPTPEERLRALWRGRQLHAGRRGAGLPCLSVERTKRGRHALHATSLRLPGLPVPALARGAQEGDSGVRGARGGGPNRARH